MRICQLEIQGFRGIRNCVVSFPSHGVLFGANNAGKSSLIDALSLLFERERMARQVSDWDFIGGEPKPDSRVTIIGTLTDFAEAGQDELENFPKWFNANAARPVWWCPRSRSVSTALERPQDAQLAAQIALSIRYAEEECEFETRRYFYYGPCDPFTDDVKLVPSERVQEIGLFVLPGNRQWEKLMSFGSSSFLKVLRSAGAIPGSSVEALKSELRSPASKIEDSAVLKPILTTAEMELRGLLMLDESTSLAYRPTNLDATSVLQSLVPHMVRADGSILPFARNGSGTVSLQAFLIVLAFAEQRKKAGKNFILVAEEPELHLHPPLHRKLASRIRNLSNQSIITTHSPLVASSFEPGDAMYVRNSAGLLTATPVQPSAIRQGPSAVRNLYSRQREALYEALMGSLVIVPEGEGDYRWLKALQRAAESVLSSTSASGLTPITLVPTQSSAVADTFADIYRIRPDTIPLIDGDAEGDGYLLSLEKLQSKPRVVIQLGKGAAIEALTAWVLDPSLANPGPGVSKILGSRPPSQKELLKALVDHKKDYALAEDLAWEAADHQESSERLLTFFMDLGGVARSGAVAPKLNWTIGTRPSGVRHCVAQFLARS